MKKQHYTIQEISQLLGIRSGTINRWIACEWLKATPLRQRGYLISCQDLKDFLNNPPSPMTRGLIALIDRNALKSVIGGFQ